MFGISGTELFVIVVFALLIFGPDKLPEYGRTLGRFTREFKRAQEQMESMIKVEMSGTDPEKTATATASVKQRTIDDVSEDEDDEEEEED